MSRRGWRPASSTPCGARPRSSSACSPDARFPARRGRYRSAAMHVSQLDAAEPFRSTDGSMIRELAGRVSLPSRNQSLAEATVPAGGATDEHYHPVAEELYFFVAGSGRLRVGRRAARRGRRRLRPDRAGRGPQARQHRRRAAAAAVLLRPAVDARRHRPDGRLTAWACARDGSPRRRSSPPCSRCRRPRPRRLRPSRRCPRSRRRPGSSPSAAPMPSMPPAAPPLPGGVRVGIGDQKADMFSDPRFIALGVRHARLAIGWDAMTSPWQVEQIDDWLKRRASCGVTPLISLGHSRTVRRSLPTPERLRLRVPAHAPALPVGQDVRDVERGQPLRRAGLPPPGARRRVLPRAAPRVPGVHDPRARDPRPAQRAWRTSGDAQARSASRRSAGACTTTSRPTASR